MEISAELIQTVQEYAQEHEKRKRYEHSLRVAVTARQMCSIYNIDPDKGYFAGLAHDICKEEDDSSLLNIVLAHGYEVSPVELKKPSLLHGPAAQYVLKDKFGVDDPDILQAVACHTLGEADLCPLAKIVFAADKVEPGREQSTDAYRENLFSMPLDKMILAVLEESIDYLTARGKEIAPQNKRFHDSLIKAVGK